MSDVNVHVWPDLLTTASLCPCRPTDVGSWKFRDVQHLILFLSNRCDLCLCYVSVLHWAAAGGKLSLTLWTSFVFQTCEALWGPSEGGQVLRTTDWCFNLETVDHLLHWSHLLFINRCRSTPEQLQSFGLYDSSCHPHMDKGSMLKNTDSVGRPELVSDGWVTRWFQMSV